LGKKDRKPSQWSEGSKKSSGDTSRRERNVSHPRAEEHNRDNRRRQGK